jgi:hypothetical protein
LGGRDDPAFDEEVLGGGGMGLDGLRDSVADEGNVLRGNRRRDRGDGFGDAVRGRTGTERDQES